MNRNLFLIPFALLMVLAFDFLKSDASNSSNGASPRASQYHEKIKGLVSIGGGSITEACRESLKHTVLVTCQTSILNTKEIHKSLQNDGWQKRVGTDQEEFKYQKQNDVLTFEKIKNFYVISLRAEK